MKDSDGQNRELAAAAIGWCALVVREDCAMPERKAVAAFRTAYRIMKKRKAK